MSTPAEWAVRYVERLGLALSPLHGKAPYREGWNSDGELIRTPTGARAHWTQYPGDNLGACLEPSGLVSLDADYAEGAARVLGAEGIDLAALTREAPTIVGRAPRLEFRAPESMLTRKALVWPPRNPGEKPVTVLEFRAGRVQDVLPPSIHPDTGKPYTWLTPPTHGFPPLPDALLALWQDFEPFRHRARNLCSWADPEPQPTAAPTRARQRPLAGPSVIAAFNDAHDVVAILEAHGYAKCGKRRWRSPYGHGMAGVVLLPSGDAVYCHHTSDALGDEKPHDAFDLFAHFEHAGDRRAAVRAAAEMLGLNRRGAA